MPISNQQMSTFKEYLNSMQYFKYVPKLFHVISSSLSIPLQKRLYIFCTLRCHIGMCCTGYPIIRAMNEIRIFFPTHQIAFLHEQQEGWNEKNSPAESMAKFQKLFKFYDLRSEGFLYKVALPELKKFTNYVFCYPQFSGYPKY